MSAIARHFNAQGKQVYGYDKTKTRLTEKLEGEGMLIHYVDRIDLLPDRIDLVVYTPAIPRDHEQLNYLKSKGYKVLKRAEVLGWLSRWHKAIAIAGTHGKTSTSSMVAHILKHGNIDISAFIGGIMTDYNSNYIAGDGDWIVLEADEYDRSFLHLKPEIAAVLSMDADHLDIYGGQEVMRASYNDFMQQVRPEGKLIIEKDVVPYLDEKTIRCIRDNDISIIIFGTEDADVIVDNARVESGAYTFDYRYGSTQLRGIKIRLPGQHNMLNAAVAITTALLLDESPQKIQEALEKFSGIKRRFELIHSGKIIFYDDYAHHPTELKAAIETARFLHPESRITGVFQPHLYSRTRDFVAEFAEALDRLDEVILLDIYPAREQPMVGVSSEMIQEKMKNPHVETIHKDELIETLKTKKIEVLMTLGAGDIDVKVPEIKAWLEYEE